MESALKRTALRKQIVKIVAEENPKLDVTIKLKDNLNLETECGFDSLMIINFITIIQDYFSIEIDFDEMDIDKIYELDVLVEAIDIVMNKGK